MKTKTFVLLIVVSLFLFGTAFYCGFQLYFTVMDAIINPICPKVICYGSNSCPLFEEAIKKVGNRTYDLETYNCVDFSKDLVRELEKIGIKSNIAINKERTHAWVVVWIEATTGNFTSPGKDLEILELRDKNMNVICE